MLTFFTVPRPFTGIYDKIQRNAIISWQNCYKEAGFNFQDILMLGDEENLVKSSMELNINYNDNLKYNDNKVPYLNSAFELAKKYSDTHCDFMYLCFCNSDVMLFFNPIDVIDIIESELGERKILLAGKRVDWPAPINISNIDDKMVQEFRKKGSWRAPYTLDYFIFNKDLYEEIPDFLIARAKYDNWLVYEAIRLGAAVVDCSQMITAVHQNHPRYMKEVSIDMKEIKHNAEITNGNEKCADLRDVTHYIDNIGLHTKA